MPCFYSSCGTHCAGVCYPKDQAPTIKRCFKCYGDGKDFHSNPNPDYRHDCWQCEGTGIEFHSDYQGIIRAEKAKGKTKEQLVKMAKQFALEHF